MSTRKGIIIIILAFFIQPIISSMLPSWLVPDLDFCILLVMALSLDGDQVVVQCGQLGIGRVVVDDQDHLHTLVIGLRFEMLADEDQSFDGLRVGASHAGGAVA